MSKRPNFFIIGAPRCGTTALYTYLQDHPQVFMSTPKEPLYFASQRGTENDYLALFKDAPSGATAIGEGSTNYIFVPQALERVKTFAPAARILAVVRNPLDAVPSLHAHNLWTNTEDVESLQEAWGLQGPRRDGQHLPRQARDHGGELAPFLQYSDAEMHGRNVRRAIEVFGTEAVRVIVFDDIKTDPAGVYASILEHLGLPSDGRRDFAVENETLSHGGKRSLSKLIVATASHPAVKSVARAVGLSQKGLTRQMASKFATKGAKTPVDPAFRAMLRDHFAEDIRVLQETIERDLSHWLD